MADLSSNLKAVIVASEDTYGVDAVAAILGDGTADIVYQELSESDVTPQRDTIQRARQVATRAGHAHATRPGTVPVRAGGPLTGRNAAGVPDYKPFLLAAMLKEVSQDAGSAVYKPWTSQQSALSIYEFIRNLDDDNWRLRSATGVRGTLTFRFEQGQEAMWSFEGEGLYDELISDDAEYFDPDTGAIALLKDGVTAVTARSTGAERWACDSPMICQGMTCTYDSVAIPIQSLEISLNVNISVKRLATGSTSTAVKVWGTSSNDGAVTGSLTAVDGDTAHDKLMDSWDADEEFELIVQCADGDGGSGSERITFTGSQVQVADVTRGDVEGAMSLTVPLRFVGDCSGLVDGSDLTITYDAVS